VGIAYDLGYASEPVRGALRDLDLLVLEANHDEGMLRTGPYPPVVRQRIASRTGHLSNHAAAELARECVHDGLREIVLAHLSQVNNEAPLATRTVGAELRRARYRGGLTPAPQGGVIGPFAPAAERIARRLQLDLAL
jgi:phosphoribosyl 1,2-cyclic phosphodiesterase